jgi:hypothetical protein
MESGILPETIRCCRIDINKFLYFLKLSKMIFAPASVLEPKNQLTTTSTRRQEQGIVSVGALRGVLGFDSWARSALVKWNVSLCAASQAGTPWGGVDEVDKISEENTYLGITKHWSR